MSCIRKNSVLLLKGEQKESYKDDSFVSTLTEGGFKVECIPVLGFQFIHLDDLQDALEHPHDYSCLLLTSPRSVEAVSNAVTDKERFLSVWSKKRTFAVGSKTGSLAESIGLKVDGSESGSSENLAPLLIKELSNDHLLLSKSVLFPCGNLKLETLPSALRSAGINVECLTVYETTADGNLRKNLEEFVTNNGFPEYLVFFSPSGLNSSSSILQQLGFLDNSDTKLVAIGPTTEKALILSEGKAVWGVASQPNAQSLLQLLRNAG